MPVYETAIDWFTAVFTHMQGGHRNVVWSSSTATRISLVCRAPRCGQAFYIRRVNLPIEGPPQNHSLVISRSLRTMRGRRNLLNHLLRETAPSIPAVQPRPPVRETREEIREEAQHATETVFDEAVRRAASSRSNTRTLVERLLRLPAFREMTQVNDIEMDTEEGGEGEEDSVETLAGLFAGDSTRAVEDEAEPVLEMEPNETINFMARIHPPRGRSVVYINGRDINHFKRITLEIDEQGVATFEVELPSEARVPLTARIQLREDRIRLRHFLAESSRNTGRMTSWDRIMEVEPPPAPDPPVEVKASKPKKMVKKPTAAPRTRTQMDFLQERDETIILESQPWAIRASEDAQNNRTCQMCGMRFIPPRRGVLNCTGCTLRIRAERRRALARSRRG